MSVGRTDKGQVVNFRIGHPTMPGSPLGASVTPIVTRELLHTLDHGFGWSITDAAVERQSGKMHGGDKLIEQRTGQRDTFELLNNGRPSMFKDKSSDCRWSVTVVGYLLRCFES